MERLVGSVEAEVRARRRLECLDLRLTVADGDEIRLDRIYCSVSDVRYSDFGDAIVISVAATVFLAML